MTINEATQYGDITLCAWKDYWYWDINCGYQKWGGDYCNSLEEAYNGLVKFLETWEGPTK
jgi:hypothetical protein